MNSSIQLHTGSILVHCLTAGTIPVLESSCILSNISVFHRAWSQKSQHFTGIPREWDKEQKAAPWRKKKTVPKYCWPWTPHIFTAFECKCAKHMLIHCYSGTTTKTMWYPQLLLWTAYTISDKGTLAILTCKTGKAAYNDRKQKNTSNMSDS